MRYHRMPPEQFAALAVGSGGPEAAAILVAAQHGKHALLLRGVVHTAETARHPEAFEARRGYELLAEVQRNDPAAVAAVVRYPSVGAWAYRTLTALRGGPPFPGATPAYLSAIAVAAAIRVGIVPAIDIPRINGFIMLPSLGAGAPDVCVTPHKAAVGEVEAAGWRGVRVVLSTPGGNVVVDDVDPFRMPAALNVAEDVDLTRWPEMFRGAWELLERCHSEVAAEVATIVRVVVPLRRPTQGQVSSSSPETFGAIATSDPVDPVTLAVTLTHETQHLKLSALLDLVPLTKPDDGSRYYAPWRDDPRPASGLLQGTYAYLGVTGFWRRMRQETETTFVMTQFARWRSAAASGAEALLSSGRLTTAGTEFVRGIAATLGRWQREPVSAAARAEASEANAHHRAAWESRHQA